MQQPLIVADWPTDCQPEWRIACTWHSEGALHWTGKQGGRQPIKQDILGRSLDDEHEIRGARFLIYRAVICALVIGVVFWQHQDLGPILKVFHWGKVARRTISGEAMWCVWRRRIAHGRPPVAFLAIAVYERANFPPQPSQLSLPSFLRSLPHKYFSLPVKARSWTWGNVTSKDLFGLSIM